MQPALATLQRVLEGLRAVQIRPAKLLAQRRVLESDGAAMRRVELPVGESVVARHQIGAVELVIPVDIDGDRAAAVPTAAVPTAAVPTPVVVAPQRRTDEESNAKADHRGADHISRRIPIKRRVSRPQPRAIDHGGIVDWDIIDAGIDRLDRDEFWWRRGRQQRRIDSGRRRRIRWRRGRRRDLAYLDLIRRLQVAVCLRLAAQLLDGIGDVVPLRQESFTELLHPLEPVIHHRQHLGHCRQTFDAGVPRLLRHGVTQPIAVNVGMFVHPPRRRDHFYRIGRSRQYLRHQIVWIERNRRQQLFQLTLAEALRRNLLRSRPPRKLRPGRQRLLRRGR